MFPERTTDHPTPSHIAPNRTPRQQGPLTGLLHIGKKYNSGSWNVLGFDISSASVWGKTIY